MNDIDDNISQALNAENQKILDQFGAEPGPIKMALATFRGNQWWLRSTCVSRL